MSAAPRSPGVHGLGQQDVTGRAVESRVSSERASVRWSTTRAGGEFGRSCCPRRVAAVDGLVGDPGCSSTTFSPSSLE